MKAKYILASIVCLMFCFASGCDFLAPRSAVGFYNRGLAKQDKGDLDGAILDYNRAIELNPKLADAYSNRGFTKQTKGDLNGAILDSVLSRITIVWSRYTVSIAFMTQFNSNDAGGRGQIGFYRVGLDRQVIGVNIS